MCWGQLVSPKAQKSQSPQIVKKDAKNSNNGEVEIYGGEGGRSGRKRKRKKRKRNKSRVENDLEVEADKALKHDLLVDGEFAVEPIREVKKKGSKGSPQGGKNGNEGGGSNQTKQKDSSNQGDSGWPLHHSMLCVFWSCFAFGLYIASLLINFFKPCEQFTAACYSARCQRKAKETSRSCACHNC